MKKVCVILMIIGSMLLTACSSNTPTGIVEKAFDAMVAGDFDTYARCFYVEDKSDPERVEKDIQDLVKLMDPKYLEVIGLFTPRGGISIYPFANYADDEHKDLAKQRMLMNFRNE